MLESNSTRLRIKQYIISPELYEKGYSGGRSPCTCTSVCCQHGVYADVKERDRILDHRETIKKHMDETQTRDESLWFEQQEEEDSDFVSGRRVGTEVVNGKCAFLDKLGRCSIQLAATAEGMHKWAIKPTFCILFPLEISDGVVGFDDLLDEEESCCSISSVFEVPLFEACKDELTHILGEDGYGELEMFYRSRHGVTALHHQ
jgi:hypothetical protein